jgi:hypothetical protein
MKLIRIRKNSIPGIRLAVDPNSMLVAPAIQNQRMNSGTGTKA